MPWRNELRQRMTTDAVWLNYTQFGLWQQGLKTPRNRLKKSATDSSQEQAGRGVCSRPIQYNSRLAGQIFRRFFMRGRAAGMVNGKAYGDTDGHDRIP